MAKFFSKKESSSSPPLTYVPSASVDYTALPMVEEEGSLARIGRLPRPLLAVAAVVVFLSIMAIAWSTYRLNKPVKAAAVIVPIASISNASATSDSAILIDGTVTNVGKAISATATLWQNNEALEWADPKSAQTTVKADGTMSLRLTRSGSWQRTIDRSQPLAVLLRVAGAKPVTATLTVPTTVAGAFYNGGARAVAATTQPTATVAATPTAAPTAAPAVGITTKINATALVSPTLGSAVRFTLPANTTVDPLFRTDDSRFFLVKRQEGVGWLPADQLALPQATVAKIRSVKPAAGAAESGPLTATVYNGGNIRFLPSKDTGTVLGQMIAMQTVTIKAKVASGQWYYVVAPNAEGWVARDLLTIDQRTIASTPIGNP
ncbi:MAG: hypothetical protein NVS4B8_17290 [Herpetosiphon sp.]